MKMSDYPIKRRNGFSGINGPKWKESLSYPYVAYLKAQDDYVQAIIQPLRKLHTSFFGKTDINILDELAKKADGKLTVFEEAIRIYVDSPPDAGQPPRNGQSGALSPANHLVQIVQRRTGGPGQV